ncbi:diguanylate cyclase [Pseudomonas sp. S 311-6]|uniref:diguanylate cyclase domain-containing protein n=1 Tax=Pseudomonas TaxID=286 RepID=UPI0020968CA7|nr:MULTISPECIES: diguanylate cyclase [Pseudomonas]MCO7565062.1 diguanylate cyclase [Pseudomonas mosselii]MCO7616339.1 diguanylate cyclase [Pseudomonas guariconensis]MCO7639358.1 diguanylate cyclase [Pseudomonas sp. S 311-6]
MTLRKRLFWLFAPPLVVVLLVIHGLAHTLILGRLDHEDEQLLVAEATHIRALVGNLLERDHDRLRNFVLSLAPSAAAGDILPLPSASLSRMNFDFLLHLDTAGQVSAAQWQPVPALDLATLGTAPVRSTQALRDDILALAQRLERDGTARQVPGRLVAAQGVPMILVGMQTPPPASGTLFAGHFLDSERTTALQRQLEGVLRLLAPERTPPHWAPLEGNEDIAISPRQVLDADRQRIFLQFDRRPDEPQLVLELPRERHLYVEGRKQIDLFLGLSALVALLAWLLTYLGLDVVLLRRISRMHQELLHIGPESAGRRLSDRATDELGLLGQETNHMLDRLERSEARDRAILQAMQEGYFELDGQGHFLAINPALATLLGLSPETVIGQPASQWLETCTEQRLGALVEAHSAGDAPLLHGRLHRADGSLGYYETRVSPIFDGQGRPSGYRGILHDVSGHVEYQNQLFDLAYRDALTGLGNRKAFYEHLTRNLAEGKGSLALLFIDLDRFKQVNDRFGHDIGDSLLVQMANRLREAVRKPDRAYRLGGDEFTLILPGTGASDAQRLAERLLQVLGAPVQIETQTIDFVTPSIGVALHPLHARDPDTLVKAADQAMYQAKRQRNRVCLFTADVEPEPGP